MHVHLVHRFQHSDLRIDGPAMGERSFPHAKGALFLINTAMHGKQLHTNPAQSLTQRPSSHPPRTTLPTPILDCPRARGGARLVGLAAEARNVLKLKVLGGDHEGEGGEAEEGEHPAADEGDDERNDHERPVL
jgi:hypothetical protein